MFRLVSIAGCVLVQPITSVYSKAHHIHIDESLTSIQILFSFIGAFMAAWEFCSGKFDKGDAILMEDDDECAHVVGSSKDKNNWKKFWIEHSGRKWPAKCQMYGCGSKPTVGAHVYLKNIRQRVYFIPLVMNKHLRKKCP